MMKKDSLKRLLYVTASTIVTWGSLSLAQTNAQNVEFDTLRPYKRRMMSDAIQVRITDRGLKKLEDQFLTIITSQGINPGQGVFKGSRWESKKAYSSDDIAKMSPEAGSIIKKVSNLFTTWLVGFNLNDHRPGVEIGNTGYIAEFKKLAISADHALMQSLGKQEGAVLSIDLEISDLKASSKTIRAFDLNNEHLGMVGLDNVTLKMREDSPSIQLKVPFYVAINQKTKALEFQNLNVQTNLKDVKLSMAYQGLVIPELALIVNGKRYDLNTQTLNEELSNEMPKILETLLSHIGDFAQNDLPQILNTKASELVIGALEQVNFLDAPGAEPNDPRGPLRWGLQAQKINLKKDLDITLNGFVEDPAQNESEPNKSHAARKGPNLDIVPSDRFDFAMSLDRAFINRIMQLSFERGLFSKINSCDGSDPLELTDVPTIDSVYPTAFTKEGNVLSTYVRLHTRTKHITRSFKEKLVLKSPFIFEVDVYARLTFNPKTAEIDVSLETFDYNSINLDSKYLKVVGRMLDKSVFDGVKAQMNTIETGWHNPITCIDGKLDTNIIGSVPITMPLGLTVSPQNIIMDPSGHLLLYMNLGNTK